MLQKLISLPEGMYYRGRFRATVAWSKVSQRKVIGDSVVEGAADPRRLDAPGRPLQDGIASARTRLQMWPTGR